MATVAPRTTWLCASAHGASRFRHDLSRPITIKARSHATARIAEQALLIVHTPFVPARVDKAPRVFF